MSRCPAPRCDQTATKHRVDDAHYPYWRCGAGHVFKLHHAEFPATWRGKRYGGSKKESQYWGCPDTACKAEGERLGDVWQCNEGHVWYPVDQRMADRFEGKPPGYLSFSAADRFHNCPLSWKHRYIDHWPDPSGRPAVLGTFVHRVLELGAPTETAMNTAQWKELAALTFTSETVTSRDFLDVMGGEGAIDPIDGSLDLASLPVRRFKVDAWGRLTKAIEILPELAPAWKVEYHLDLPIGPVPFDGHVDRIGRPPGAHRVTGAVDVLDWKSGAYSEPYRDKPDTKAHQGALYAVGISDSLGLPVRNVDIIYLNHAEPVMKCVDPVATRTPAVEWLTEAWEGIAARKATGHFEATPSGICPWCPYVMSCPEGQGHVAEMLKRPATKYRDAGWPKFAASPLAERLRSTPIDARPLVLRYAA